MSATFNPLLIVQHLPEGEVTIDKLANKLNIPRRILQRITEIAFSLGYADQGSFSSAFKSWHRVSPRDYRRK
jgi:AraC-like DNA-binding protein